MGERQDQRELIYFEHWVLVSFVTFKTFLLILLIWILLWLGGDTPHMPALVLLWTFTEPLADRVWLKELDHLKDRPHGFQSGSVLSAL